LPIKQNAKSSNHQYYGTRVKECETESECLDDHGLSADEGFFNRERQCRPPLTFNRIGDTLIFLIINRKHDKIPENRLVGVADDKAPGSP